FNPQNAKSSMLRTHCQTSGVSLTEQDPYNNIVRTTVEAMAGVLGGTQSLHTNSFDEALGLPTEFSAKIARNTQLILAEETGITRTVDPLAGSYYVESLTADLADRAREILAEVEAAGGMTKAIAEGTPKLRIEEAAALRQVRVDRGWDTIVGVNKYVADDADHVDVLDIDNTEVRQQQVRRLEEVRSQRDAGATEAALSAVTDTAIGQGNLLAACIEAARARATVGEISDAMEAVFERHRAQTKLLSGVYSAAYADDPEYTRLTEAVESFGAERGRNPHMFVAKMGQDGHDRGGRVIATAFADMGFDVSVGPLFQTPAEAAAEASKLDVDVVGVSSHAAGHLTLVPELIAALEAEGSDIMVVCGGVIPPKDYEPLKDAGVVAIFGPGTHVPDAAADVLNLLRDQA
ncbi:MAG: methylmalonyl-CoA mutase family protein, partial [Acidimicrobiales bacterium]